MDDLLSHANLTGRVHRSLQQNGQDGAFVGRIGESAFGVVLDGCGSKVELAGLKMASSNEVGSRLIGQFIAASLNQALGEPCPLPLVLSSLYQDTLAFLSGLLRLMPFSDEGQIRFLAGHLLCTIVGFVVTPDSAAFFWRGDGYLIRDGHASFLDSNNLPDYLAYDLLEGTDNGCFETRFLERQELSWLAVATDGWSRELLQELATPRAPLALQRWLNVQARRPGHFDDDGAVAAWYPSSRPGEGHEH